MVVLNLSSSSTINTLGCEGILFGSFRLSVDREVYGKSGTLTHITGDRNATSQPFDYPTANGKTQSGPLAMRLCGKEWREDFVQILCGDTAPRVRDPDFYGFVFIRFCGDRYCSILFHCVHCVDEQIEHDLAQ
jgi:hypothetical protein